MSFLRLLQLASPALPVGAYAYSQGLEPAVVAGLVNDEASARNWILELLAESLTYLDIAVFARIHRAAVAGDDDSARFWNAYLLASRSTAELQAEDCQMGSSLARVLSTMGMSHPLAHSVGQAPATSVTDPAPTNPSNADARTFAAMFAVATAFHGINLRLALEAFAFNWVEAQTSAAVRLVPLGQSAGVRILAGAAEAISRAVDLSLTLADEDVGASAPLHALLSTAHETQYSRLFRS